MQVKEGNEILDDLVKCKESLSESSQLFTVLE